MSYRITWRQNTLTEPDRFDQNFQLEVGTFFQAIRALVGVVASTQDTGEGSIVRAFPVMLEKI